MAEPKFFSSTTTAGNGLKNSRFDVCWWNGGGVLLKRLKVNPVLRNVLDKQPEIFFTENPSCQKVVVYF